MVPIRPLQSQERGKAARFRIAANAACQAALMIAQLSDFPGFWSSIIHSD